MKIMEEIVEVGDLRIAVAISRLANGALIFVSDGEHRIGTIGVGVPTPFGDVSPTATSCVVGTRFQAGVRAIADIAAQRLGGIVVVNLFLSKEEDAYLSSALSAVQQLISKIESVQKES